MIGNSAREKILSRLYAASGGRESFHAPPSCVVKEFSVEKHEYLKRLLKDAGAQVWDIDRRELAGTLKTIKAEFKLRTVCCGVDIWYDEAVCEAFADAEKERIRFNRPLEEFKDILFSVDAGIVTAQAAIAETGSLCLFPGADEPRSLSLVPPVLIVILLSDAIFGYCQELFASPLWKTSLSRNPVFIAGPSRCMAIEGQIVSEAGGPRELAVIIAH